MKKILLSLLIFAPALYAKSPADCVSPTEFIIQYLKKSGTVWRGSTQWKSSLESMPNDIPVHTNFAATHTQDYWGVSARYIQLDEPGVKSSFVITKKEGCFEVDSNIQHIEQTIVSEDDVQWFKMKHRYQSENKTVQEDYSTRCEYIETMKFDEKTRKLSTILIAQCKSKIIHHRFAKELNQ